MAIELPKRLAENIDQFTGRAWLLPEILSWWEGRPQVRLLLLTGGPGTGKSMILAWLAGFGPEPENGLVRNQLEGMRQVVKAVHFCQAASRNISPQAFAESVANQLTDTVKGFGDALAATLADRVSIVGTAQAETAASGSSLTGVVIDRIDLGTLGDELSFDRAFTQPLKKLYADGYSEPMLLLVDALDEAQTYTGVTLPGLLSRLADLPAPVRILVTTRDEPRVLKFFHGAKVFDLITDVNANTDDVRTYAEGRLSLLSGVDKITRRDFAERLTIQADGVFLYAAMVLDGLLEDPSSNLPDLDTHPLPRRLSGLFHDFLTRELGKDDEGWFDLYEPLLGLIAVAQGDGLTTQQLADIVGKDIRAPLRASKQYLNGELPSGPFRLFHESFTDFVFEDEENVDYHIDASVMHGRIADHLFSKYDKQWSKCSDEYALRYLPIHLSESAQTAGAVRDAPIRRLVKVTGDLQYRRRCEERFGAEVLLDIDKHMASAVLVATLSRTDEMLLPCLVRAARGFVDFRREILRGESIVALAEQGNVEGAQQRLTLFPDLEQDWQLAASLIISWLAMDCDQPRAVQLRDGVAKTLPEVEPLRLLLDRLDNALMGKASYPCELQPAQGIDVGRALVLRVSGQLFDRELLMSRGMEVLAPLTSQSRFIAERGYAASLDGPVLVNIARESGIEGTELLDEYIGAHTGYNYAQYRNRSLMMVLNAVLRNHPGQSWVRDRLKRILLAALSGGAPEFTEMSPLVAAVLLETARADGVRVVLDDYSNAAFEAIQFLSNRCGANDTWSLHKRRLTALMEIEALVFRDITRARHLRERIADLEKEHILEGFAGFQVPAELRLADAHRACGFSGSDDLDARLERALISAHHIQDYRLCARITASCNALQRWHATLLEGQSLVDTVRRFSESPDEVEFSARHLIHEPFRHREADNPDTLSVNAASEADTLERLADVFQRPVTELLRVNPAAGSRDTIPPNTWVNVPDPAFSPLLALHFSARILAEGSLGEKREELIRSLVPVAARNETVLDTVLSYLFIVSAPARVEVLEELVRSIGAVSFVDASIPSAQVGPE